MKRVALAIACAAALCAAEARADEKDPASAQFELGLAAMKAERYETACPAFAESYRLDPHAGVVFTLAECEVKWGKLASALTHYQAYVDTYAKMKPEEKGRQGRRPEIARSQLQTLAEDIPRIIVKLVPSAPAGTTVVIDNLAVPANKLGTPLPMDPGEHMISVHRPDATAEDTKVTLAVRERRTLELGSTIDAKAAPTPPATPDKPAPEPEQPDQGRSPVPLIAAIGVGVVGIGVGAVTGLMATAKKDTIDQHCQDTRCDATGKDAADSAKGLATISTIGFGVGAAGAVTALVLILTAPSKKAASSAWQPHVSVGPTTMVGVAKTF